jgi:outer membrane protein assembly factor BamD
MSLRKLIPLILLISITLFSCAKKKEEEKSNAELEYTKAYKALQEKDYNKAAEDFEKIDDNYPFSKWATKAKTMAVYARYKNSELDKVLSIIDDYITLNPTSEYMPYMLYMKGLAYYDQIPSIERSQENTRMASSTFRELIVRYPDSDYSADAKERLDFIDEHLAGYHMALGRYQIDQENYIAAIPNFHEVIERYRNSKQVPEAFFRLHEIYQKLGIKEDAKIFSIELTSRFPNSYWAKESNKVFGNIDSKKNDDKKNIDKTKNSKKNYRIKSDKRNYRLKAKS